MASERKLARLTTSHLSEHKYPAETYCFMQTFYLFTLAIDRMGSPSREEALGFREGKNQRTAKVEQILECYF